LSTRGPGASTGDAGTHEPGRGHPTLAPDRTALAWTRSALNIAGSGVLIARAAFTADLDALGVASAIALALVALLTWHHGQTIYRDRGLEGGLAHHEPVALRWLTAATLLIGVVAIVVTVAI
jgi:uncharacterized membrane protein YidH (DUF202 family)